MGVKAKLRRLGEEVRARFVGNEENIYILTLNLLHQRSTALIRGPRGRGKSTLMLLFLKGIFGEEYVVLSGASEIKRGEVVARLHIPSLEREGVERVVWSSFVKAKGKGIDEVNRLNPYTAASIYHMLQFGEVWAYGQKFSVDDYILFATENPADPTTFIHPPPFYDRFDVVVYMNSLTLSEKFRLEEINEKYTSLIDSMPHVLSFDDILEARKEVQEIELDVEIKGLINILVRDLQACLRHRDISPIKPPALCEGCHYMRNICSSIREGPSERATLILTHLVRGKLWLEGKIEEMDVYNLAIHVLPHRLELVKRGFELSELRNVLHKQYEIMEERKKRKQWIILDKLLDGFSHDLYRLAREIAVEDLVFAEELMKLEEKWVEKGVLKHEETLRTQLL